MEYVSYEKQKVRDLVVVSDRVSRDDHQRSHETGLWPVPSGDEHQYVAPDSIPRRTHQFDPMTRVLSPEHPVFENHFHQEEMELVDATQARFVADSHLCRLSW